MCRSPVYSAWDVTRLQTGFAVDRVSGTALSDTAILTRLEGSARAMNRHVANGVRAARRVVVGVIGSTVLIVGLALLVLPGPAVVVVPIGLGILAIEFEWARRWLRRARRLYAPSNEPEARVSRPE